MSSFKMLLQQKVYTLHLQHLICLANLFVCSKIHWLVDCQKKTKRYLCPGKLPNIRSAAIDSEAETNIVRAQNFRFKCEDGPEGWSRCHQLMELGRGSSEKCLEICKMCPVASKSRREISSLGNGTQQLSWEPCCLRHLKWTLSTNSFVTVTTKEIHM